MIHFQNSIIQTLGVLLLVAPYLYNSIARVKKFMQFLNFHLTRWFKNYSLLVVKLKLILLV